MGSLAEAVVTQEAGWGSRSARLVSGYAARITDPGRVPGLRRRPADQSPTAGPL